MGEQDGVLLPDLEGVLDAEEPGCQVENAVPVGPVTLDGVPAQLAGEEEVLE